MKAVKLADGTWAIKGLTADQALNIMNGISNGIIVNGKQRVRRKPNLYKGCPHCGKTIKGDQALSHHISSNHSKKEEAKS